MAATCTLVGCRQEAHTSPTGKYRFEPYVIRDVTARADYLTIAFKLYDAEGKEIAELRTHAPDRADWKMGWDDYERIWINSRDIGMWYWERRPDTGSWVRKEWKVGGPETPAHIHF